jgi:putative acetyltransferase
VPLKRLSLWSSAALCGLGNFQGTPQAALLYPETEGHIMEILVVKLRMYRESDAEGLAALFTSSVHGLGATQYSAEQRRAWAPVPPDLDEWRQRFGGLHTIVAEDDGTYLGFLSYEANGHIDLLYTSPHAARRGIASALLREAVARLSAAGEMPGLFAEASLIAAPFFLRHGFEIMAERHVVLRGVNFQRFVMRRSAGDAQPGAAADPPSADSRLRGRG